MRIVVTVKQILDPTGFVVHRRREMIFINREEYIINPNDKNALEEALKLKDTYGAEVIAISLATNGLTPSPIANQPPSGEPRADDALREALAIGADEAILLTDEAFAEADVAVATLILGRAIEKLGDFDLIISGQEALDSSGRQLGPRLAEYLGLPQVTGVYKIVSLDDGRLRAEQGWGRGCVEVEVGLPALLTIAPDANRPHYPHGARIMDAYREWEVTTWGCADLDLREEELRLLTQTRRRAFPPPREFGYQITGTPEEAARELVQYLKSRKVI